MAGASLVLLGSRGHGSVVSSVGANRATVDSFFTGLNPQLLSRIAFLKDFPLVTNRVQIDNALVRLPIEQLIHSLEALDSQVSVEMIPESAPAAVLIDKATAVEPAKAGELAELLQVIIQKNGKVSVWLDQSEDFPSSAAICFRCSIKPASGSKAEASYAMILPGITVIDYDVIKR